MGCIESTVDATKKGKQKVGYHEEYQKQVERLSPYTLIDEDTGEDNQNKCGNDQRNGRKDYPLPFSLFIGTSGNEIVIAIIVRGIQLRVAKTEDMWTIVLLGLHLKTLGCCLHTLLHAMEGVVCSCC